MGRSRGTSINASPASITGKHPKRRAKPALSLSPSFSLSFFLPSLLSFVVGARHWGPSLVGVCHLTDDAIDE